DFALSLPNFLHNSVHLREPRWNLPNRVLDHGFVYITRDEVARLIEEEVRTKILERSGRTLTRYQNSWDLGWRGQEVLSSNGWAYRRNMNFQGYLCPRLCRPASVT